MDERRVGLECPPQPWLAAHILGKVLEDLGFRSWGLEKFEQWGHRTVGIVDRESRVTKAPIVEAGRSQQGSRCGVECGIVGGVDGVQRDPHQ